MSGLCWAVYVRGQKWRYMAYFWLSSSQITPKITSIIDVKTPAQKPSKKVCVNKSICKNNEKKIKINLDMLTMLTIFVMS